VAAKIKGLWKATQMNQAQIAAALGGINQGRVSEVVRGLRFAEVPPAELGGVNG
jgi:predicted XRE-type DNA-binding protein